MTRIHERYYSISSTPNDNPYEVSISVGVVNIKTNEGVSVRGVLFCSNYLARLRPFIDLAKVSIRTSNFRGPKNTDSPVMMIGSGTGLAPLMGYLQDRAADLSERDPSEMNDLNGQCHLFYGCRTQEDPDFL